MQGFHLFEQWDKGPIVAVHYLGEKTASVKKYHTITVGTLT